MAATPHETERTGDAEDRPWWLEEFEDPTWWDHAFGGYGDGYLEWVDDRYFWPVVSETPRRRRRRRSHSITESRSHTDIR